MTYKRCNNCLTTHTGNHPFMCTDCAQALKATGVRCSPDAVMQSRQAWWVSKPK